MRILMVLDKDFPPDIRVENEARALIAAGHEVHLACYDRKGKAPMETWSGIHIHRRPIGDLTYKSSVAALKAPIYFSFWKRFLSKVTDDTRFDAIHIHDLPLAKTGLEIARRRGIPMVLDLHENWPAMLDMATHTQSMAGRILSSTRQWERYEARMVERADAVVTVVDESRARVAALCSDPGKVFVVSNTPDLDEFDPTADGGGSEGLRMFYAGGLNYHRGLQIVIRGMADLKTGFPDLSLDIFGSGSYMDELRKLSIGLGLESRVAFHGWQSLDVIEQELGKASITLIPHLRYAHTDSTIPHKLFQYMLASKPVLASDARPLERILAETGAGLSYRSDSAQAFTEALKRMLSDPESMSRMGQLGRQAVLSKYNWAQDAQTLLGIYAGFEG